MLPHPWDILLYESTKRMLQLILLLEIMFLSYFQLATALKSLCYACLPGTFDKFLNITNCTVVIIRFASD